MQEQQFLTPLMRQYHEVKGKFPDALVLFQVGDFYELFYDDARKAAAYLGIALTQRSAGIQEPIPLCGVPVHVVDHYLIKLVKGGFRVVVCDQQSKNNSGKLIERSIKKVLTPGTLTDSGMLNDKSASYCGVVFPTLHSVGIIFMELLSQQIFITVLDADDTPLQEAELARFLPDEIVLPESKLGALWDIQVRKWGYITTVVSLNQDEGYAEWINQFSESQRSWISCSPAAQSVVQLLYCYLKKHCPDALQTNVQLLLYQPHDYLILDASTQRNLELTKNSFDGSTHHTLFSILDRAITPMGSRHIKKWICRPLAKREAIEQRLNAVELLVQHKRERHDVSALLKRSGDSERIIGRLALERASIADYRGLKQSLAILPDCYTLLKKFSDPLLNTIAERLTGFEPLYTLLENALNDDSNSDWYIKSGYNEQLDQLRNLAINSTQALLAMEIREQQATGINSLKIRFNRVHGYGIEVTKPNLALVPEHYIRVQTLTSRDRFTTQELKDLEYDIDQAQAKVKELEAYLFEALRKEVLQYIPSLKKMTQAIGHFDALLGLAESAQFYHYVKPMISSQRDIIIKDGWHPVVGADQKIQFIPNDTQLTEEERLWIVTGPNMGGKSTYLRQVALIVLMAHIGSYVPAQNAEIPLIDRIFTRIGAADNVAAGKSTFLVEMEEAALICTRATSNSLVILDEVGRGTSTYDGLALAQAITEYIYTHVKARCLFATHYHELTSLEQHHPGIVAYHAASNDTPAGVILLHKILRGTAVGSFGIEVARKAGLPPIIIDRAQRLLGDYQADKGNEISLIQSMQTCTTCERFRRLNIDNLTPRQAHELLWDITHGHNN